MTLTRSYNKHTDTYYVYETTYTRDVKTNKMIQKKRCIGKIDNVTGEIIPTGQRGRPKKTIEHYEKSQNIDTEHVSKLLDATKSIAERLRAVNTTLQDVAVNLDNICHDAQNIFESLNKPR